MSTMAQPTSNNFSPPWVSGYCLLEQRHTSMHAGTCHSRLQDAEVSSLQNCQTAPVPPHFGVSLSLDAISKPHGMLLPSVRVKMTCTQSEHTCRGVAGFVGCLCVLRVACPISRSSEHAFRTSLIFPDQPHASFTLRTPPARCARCGGRLPTLGTHPPRYRGGYPWGRPGVCVVRGAGRRFPCPPSVPPMLLARPPLSLISVLLEFIPSQPQPSSSLCSPSASVRPRRT